MAWSRWCRLPEKEKDKGKGKGKGKDRDKGKAQVEATVGAEDPEVIKVVIGVVGVVIGVRKTL